MSVGSVKVVSSDSDGPCWDLPTTSVSPTELPSPLESLNTVMSQSVVRVSHSMRTLAFALSMPAPCGTVKPWSFQHVSSSVSASAHGVVVVGLPLKLIGALGWPVATRPRSFATAGRVDGLTCQVKRPVAGTSSTVSSLSSIRIGLPSSCG